MNLSYRGVKYEVAPATVKVVEGASLGCYRGATYRVKQATNESRPSRVAGLKYRGASVR